jgi:hypothetical protein
MNLKVVRTMWEVVNAYVPMAGSYLSIEVILRFSWRQARAVSIARSKIFSQQNLLGLSRAANSHLEGMLMGVQERVVKLIEEIAPDLAEHDWVWRWRNTAIEQ